MISFKINKYIKERGEKQKQKEILFLKFFFLYFSKFSVDTIKKERKEKKIYTSII